MFLAITFAKVVIKTETSRPLNETWNFMQRKKGIIALYNDTVAALVIKWANLDTSQG